MSAGGAGENAYQPVRVQLLDAPPTEPRKRASEPPEQRVRPATAPRAKAAKPRPEKERRQAAARPRTRVAPLPQKPVKTAGVRTRAAAKKPPPRPERQAEPAQTTRPATAPTPAENIHAASAPARVTAPQPPRESGGHGTAPEQATAPKPAPIARGVAPAGPAGRSVGAASGFIPARYARTVKPRYPGKARRAGWEGTTVLKVLVDPDGAPDRVAVDRTSGFEVLDAAAVKAVQRWKFHPARRGTDAVASWVRIPVAFKLKENRLP